MQEQQAPTPPPSPTAPSVEIAPPATATAVFPGGQVTVGALPQTFQELEGLRERREILRDQLSRATNRREELVNQLNETGNTDARTGLQQRLTLLDERILQLERDQAQTEQLLSSAPPEVLALAVERAERASGSDDEAIAMMGFFAFGFGLLIATLVGRWRRRRMRKRGGTGSTSAVDEAKLERLSQAVDAIAVEVERIGEGQRFVTQLLAERRPAPAVTERALSEKP